MSAATLEAAIKALASDAELLASVRADPVAGAEKLGLSQREAEAVLSADRDALRSMGVNDGLSILVSRWFQDDLADAGSKGAFVVDRTSPLPRSDVPANLVFAGACSHVPDLLARPEIDPQDGVARLTAGYEALAQRIAAADLDVLIVTTDCHFQNFVGGGTVFGVGEGHEGSLAFFKRPDIALQLTGAPDFAQALLKAARDKGLEVEAADTVELDHGLIVPLKQMLPRADLPIVPIVTQPARGFSPFSARALGQALRNVVETSGKRIGVLATGGLSHWLDPGRFGRADVPFDTYILDMIAAGRANDLANLEPFPLLEHGQYEFMNWLIMFGLVGPGIRGDVLAYEPMEASGGGWAVVYMDLDPA